MNSNIEVLARQRIELVAQADAIKDRIAAIDELIVDAIEVGGHVDLDGQPVWRVQQRRTFSLDKARELVSPEVIAAATVEVLDPKLLQSLLPPLLRDACMADGKIFVAKAGR